MSTRRRPGRPQDHNSTRSNTSILTIAFAIAMAFFLVVGMVAVALPQFIGGGTDDPPQQEAPSNIQEEGESEEEQLRQRLEENPDDYSAKTQLAVLLSNSGRVEEAIPYYEDALEESPDDVSLRLSFARALNRQGYTLDAEVQLEQVLEDDPDNVEAMYVLAETKAQDGPESSKEATALYEQIIETDPDSYYAEMAQDRLAGNEEGAPAGEEPEDSNEDQD